ncbi:MAG: integrase, partial [Desulfurococcaceae archaeon]
MGQESSSCVLEEWQARELLMRLNKALSIRKIALKLGVSKSTVHRWLKSGRIPSEYLTRICEVFPEEELLAVLRADQLLQHYGIMSSDGRVNKPLVLALLDAMLRNDVLKEEVLNYILKYYKAELTERLGEAIPRIELKWTPEFERWLLKQDGRPGKPVSHRTLVDYKRIWSNCLEGKVLGWHLIRQLSGKHMECRDGRYHPTGWARQVVRHYIKYLYSKGVSGLDWDTYTRLMLAIPGRGYGRKVSQKPVPVDKVVEALDYLRQNNEKIYLVYTLMLYSGVRFEHVIHALNSWNPSEELYVEYLDTDIKRLTCFVEQGFCRYYLGLESSRKPEAFMYFPVHLLELVEKYKGSIPRRDTI